MSSVLVPSRVRLTVEQFHEMGRAGIFTDGSRVELIEGALIDMAPIGSLHASVVSTLSMTLATYGELAIISPQNPVSLPPYDEPQPDIALLKVTPDRYRDALPTATDVLLIIEVADTTLQYDRTVKLPLYAKHGIPEVWIVNLPDRVLELYREPEDESYRVRLERTADDKVSPAGMPSVELELRSLWGA